VVKRSRKLDANAARHDVTLNAAGRSVNYF
jgi:hypothetical protein